MRLIGVIVVLLLAVAGCATMQLPKGSTGAEKSAALCSDAKSGLALGQIGLTLAASEAERAYWGKWLAGAEQARQLYCGE